MAIDPTGYKAALATIQPGQLSERQQRIAAGLAMVRDGSSLKAAAKAAHVPLSTLWNYKHGVSSLESSRSWEQDLESVNDVSFDVALIAAEAIRESLINDADLWKPGDLVKAYGVATDKVIALSQRGAAQPAGIRDLLGAMLDEGDVTIKRRPVAGSVVELEVEAEIGK